MRACAAVALQFIEVFEEFFHGMELFLYVLGQFRKHVLVMVFESELSVWIACVDCNYKVLAFVKCKSNEVIWGGDLNLLLAHRLEKYRFRLIVFLELLIL
jgi:hypothetical protein